MLIANSGPWHWLNLPPGMFCPQILPSWFLLWPLRSLFFVTFSDRLSLMTTQTRVSPYSCPATAIAFFCFLSTHYYSKVSRLFMLSLSLPQTLLYYGSSIYICWTCGIGNKVLDKIHPRKSFRKLHRHLFYLCLCFCHIEWLWLITSLWQQRPN